MNQPRQNTAAHDGDGDDVNDWDDDGYDDDDDDDDVGES